ncbi:GIY-YIG nuclease family protein [Scytonema sp. PCC 10023]|uniref:GIY-YIG nuclease family protein n=1 Tax=Scytonema sp. PCC 10023 TaxID=1680591 RepID=UPI0039C71A00
MPHYNQNYWQERNDNEPGFIYLILAEGYHGWVPGCVLKRVKIGLSRNPEARLETFHSNQPPCNLRILRTIYVENMAEVEQRLHQVFKNSNVKLKKSREFFDLLPWQMAYLHWLMSQYEVKVWSYADIPKRAIAGGLVALLGVGLLVGYGIRESTTPQLEQTIETK